MIGRIADSGPFLVLMSLAAVAIAPTGIANAQVSDDFSRPDAGDLGNGWIEKNPQAFSLAGGEANKQATGLAYRDNIVYRPATEELLDVEVAVELRLTEALPGYPQVFTRVQSATVAQPNTLDAYILYVNNSSTEAILGRQTDAFFVTPLTTLTIQPALNVTDRYRLRLRSTGANPVQLAAFVERWDGSDWIVDGQATASDAAAAAITTAGSVGFGGYVEPSYRYDNFTAADIGSGSNPLPSVTALAPASATEGGSAFSLTVTGSDFIPGSVVRWNGSDRATTFVSATEISASITAADIAAAGSASVTVFNPAPGGGISASRTFTIDPVVPDNPTPALTSLAPAAATEGGGAFTLTVTGSDFVTGSVVRWNGSDRTTTYVSATELQADIAAADIATAGSATVTVFNPAPGGGISGPQTFTIDPATVDNPPPVLTSLNPTSATEGGSAFSLTLNGSDFLPGSVVRWNGSDRATTFISATELAAAVTAADIAAAGSAAVTVFNPAPGGGASAPQTFTIDPAASGNPVPVLTSIDPIAAGEGDPGFVLTVNGSGFIPGSVVRWNGSDRSTTFVSATELSADIAAADIATAGTNPVTVFTPAPGGGSSAPQVFTVQASGTQFFDPFARPDAADLGNGWIEKNPLAFALAGGAAAKQATGLAYRDNVVYRPAAEDLLDVEASVEMRLTDALPGYPQILTRIQSGTVAQPNTLDGYILYISNSATQAILGRQRDAYFVTQLATLTISPALNTTDTYRLRLRSTGANPVQLAAFVERWNGSGWDIIGQGTASDASAAAITSAGSVGFGGYVEASYAYDNFTATDLGDGSNPLPVLTSLNPSSATAGGSAFSLTVSGSDFIPGSVVRWNGSDRVTTYVSATELQAAVTAADIASAGSASVSVFTPGPGGGSSADRTFTIDPVASDNPLPTLASLNPNAATEGDPGFTLVAAGSDFVPGSVVRWDGSDRVTTFVSATELQAAITAADVATAGSASVTVFSPAPGGGVSAPQTFTVNPTVPNNPIPVAASLQPATATEGGPAFSLTVNGSGFVAASVVRWNGVDRATTYVSPTELEAAISAADIANAGSAGVRVFNPFPGGGLSGALTFTIDPAGPVVPPPVLDSTVPESTTVGASGQTIAIVGSNFDAQSVAYWNGAPRPTTVISDQLLEMTLPASDFAAADVNTVTVVNSAAPAVISRPLPFFVLEENSTYFFDSFNTPNSESLGNGWTEKTPEVFSITDNAVTSIWFDRVYRDTIAYRPAAEDRIDVEVSAEFVRQPAGQFTQLHARAQRNTITTPNVLESYIFFVEDNVPSPGAMAIAINPPIYSMGECIIDQIPLPEALRVGDRYRMRFLVTGQNPVRLEGRVEWFNNGAWQPFFEATVFHDDTTVPPGYYCAPGYMPAPITGSGTTGMAKWVDQADDYDNFYWIDLSGETGVPSIASATPDTVTVGGEGFTLLVDGANFTPNSVVRWDGSDRVTSYIDSTTLQAVIAASDIAVEGDFAVTVSTPPPGGGVSNAVTVSVAAEGQAPNPPPALTAIAPESIPAGSGSTQITITGSGFVPGSVLRWNGNDRATNLVSDTELTATIEAADLAAAGSAVVSVFNPTPGGGLSEPRSVAIVASGDFTDTFARPDSPDPQNGWTEKNAGAFSIAGGSLIKNSTGSGYLDNVMYRPVAEARADVETSVEVQLSASLPGYPQIFARLQPATVTSPGVLDGYILYINNGNTAILGRQEGASFVIPLATIALSEALTIGPTYRLRLSAVGSASVTVSGAVERLAPNGFVVIGQASFQDTSPQRVTEPGVSGIGGYVEGGSYSYDNFRDSSQP